MNKVVVSECCQAGVQHYPTMNLNPMENVVFFCVKCNKQCKIKIVKEDKKK